MSQKQVEGDLRAFSIFDIAQSLLMGRKDALVAIESGEKRGTLNFADGHVVAATDDDLQVGEAAVMNIFSWREGTFRISFDRASPERNVTMPTDSLLLEVARNLDEHRREETMIAPAARAPSVKGEARERASERLRTELRAAFQRAADTAEPSRARYTANAFDPLLQALLDLNGTALFLRPGHEPRVRVGRTFRALKEEMITPVETEGFLANTLSEGEARELRERKEVATFFHSPVLGTFRLTVVDEGGTHLLTFTPAERPVPVLDFLLGDPASALHLARLEEGLIVVSGPLGSGKETLSASIIRAQMLARSAFAVHFAAGVRHGMGGDAGFCVQRLMPPPGPALVQAVRAALDQGPDILALEAGADRGAFLLGLAVAASGRLVIATVESHSPADLVTRIDQTVRGSEDEEAAREALARALKVVIDVQPGGAGEPDAIKMMPVDRETASLIRAGDRAALRRLCLGSPVPAGK